jgi:hypothetical protein
MRDKLKTSPLGGQLNIDQKLSLRDKQKAKRRAEDEEDRIFFE